MGDTDTDNSTFDSVLGATGGGVIGGSALFALSESSPLAGAVIGGLFLGVAAWLIEDERSVDKLLGRNGTGSVSPPRLAIFRAVEWFIMSLVLNFFLFIIYTGGTNSTQPTEWSTILVGLLFVISNATLLFWEIDRHISARLEE
jgi:hypothetical protein